MGISVAQLQAYMAAGLNVMITGPAGTGKTAMLKQAAANLNWKMKYLSAATLDPFSDLYGIPVPNKETKSMEYYRDGAINEADVLFFDEINRAPDSVINAVFEVTQFRELHGVPLPNLKAVVVALNPSEDGYEGVSELDLAFCDRFDVYLSSEVKADYAYLKAKFGADYARARVTIFDEYQKSYNASLRSKQNKLGYFSPRRLEKLLDIYKAFPKPETVKAVLPADVTLNARQTAQVLNDALRPKPAGAPKIAGPVVDAHAGPSGLAERQLKMEPSDLRRKSNADVFMLAYREAKAADTKVAEKLRTKLATALNYGVGPETIAKVWGEAVRDFNPTQKRLMENGWQWQKIDATRRAISRL